MKYEIKESVRSNSSQAWAPGRHWVDLEQTAVFDGVTFTRASCGDSYESLGRSIAAAQEKVRHQFWKAEKGPIQVRCICGSSKFTLTYGDYQLNATCVECGAVDEVYGG